MSRCKNAGKNTALRYNVTAKFVHHQIYVPAIVLVAPNKSVKPNK